MESRRRHSARAGSGCSPPCCSPAFSSVRPCTRRRPRRRRRSQSGTRRWSRATACGRWIAVTLSQPGTSTVSVAATITAGDATVVKPTNPDADFNDKSGATKPLTFKVVRGKTPVVKYVAVSVYPDAVQEEDETMHVTLSSPSSGWMLGRTEATGTIVDDDASPKSGIEVSIGDAAVHEGDATKRPRSRGHVVGRTPGRRGTCRVTRSPTGTRKCGPTRAGLPVVPTDDCFDNAGRTKTLVFKAGQRLKAVAAFVFSDTETESDQSFAVHFVEPGRRDTARRYGHGRDHR